MQKTVVIDIVGLSESVIGKYTPFLSEFFQKQRSARIAPMLPAVTTSVQSTYLTGKWPSEHGIVGNGWYDRTDCEVKFWKQSNKLVDSEKIWDTARRKNNSFTCANMFWWYNMYSTVDYSVTPRPNYLADGRKMPDCYSHPAGLRDELQKRLGQFPLFQFWGPGANIRSTEWIADASLIVEEEHNPTLTFIYLPHLDYCLQKFGPSPDVIAMELKEIDAVAERLVNKYKQRGARIIILSEYGISGVSRPIHINRRLREAGMLSVRVERGLELLDPGASKVFAVADHQVAHIYVNDETVLPGVKELLTSVNGIQMVLDHEGKNQYNLSHERAGDLVAVAAEDHWFTYYFWLDDAMAPDYARTVDIHKKPGYDPVEMFMSSKVRAAYKLLRKKMALRYVMDVIPLDASLIRGSHGRTDTPPEYFPLVMGDISVDRHTVAATEIYQIIWRSIFGEG